MNRILIAVELMNMSKRINNLLQCENYNKVQFILVSDVRCYKIQSLLDFNPEYSIRQCYQRMPNLYYCLDVNTIVILLNALSSIFTETDNSSMQRRQTYVIDASYISQRNLKPGLFSRITRVML